MERYARLITQLIAVVVLGSLASLGVAACGERKPCNAPVKSLDTPSSAAPMQ